MEIQEVKALNPENKDLNRYYKKFLAYLGEVEKELETRYKKEVETEIEMEFRMGNNYNMNCHFHINDDNVKEKDFKEEGILNGENHDIYTYMAQELE